jgi:pyruvate dehydrogenase E2 component (dihydrolipoamide acetyltransferase)
LARKIAAERGVNLAVLAGTGPGGRIVRADVLAAGTNGGSSAPGLPVIRPVVGPDDVRVPLSPIRSIIASRLLASKTQIPHFYLNIEVDAAPLMAFRAQANQAEEAKGSGVKFTVNDFILKAAAAAAAEVPAVNASFDVDAIVRFKSVNLAVAIAIDDGLVTPVIPDAQAKSLSEISAAVKDLAKRAKENKLRPDEFAHGTLTISNLGAYGIDTFDAIINPPQAAILSIGAIVKKPVVDAAGQLAVGQRLWIGMSCDHRVVDGAVGATYLQALRKLIEAPALMLL